MRINLLLPWLAPGLLAGAAIADEVVPDGHLVVTATRIATPLEEVLAPVIVIDREAIERSVASDVPDLLRFHAGLDLSRNGGPGQTTGVFIRGADSNHTLVLVDGVRINPGTIGLAALQNIAPSSVERIEVVKGPRSALYGTDAIGGVVNVITRRGSRDGWSAEVGYGDYDTREANLVGGFGGERVELDLGFAWLDSSGFPTRSDDDVDRGYRNTSLTAQLRAPLGSGEVALRHWRSAGTSEYSDFFLTPVDQDYETSTTSLRFAWPITDAARLQATASHLEDRVQQNQSPDYLRTRRDSLDAQVDWTPVGRHAFGAGAMFSRERAGSESFGDVMQADTDQVNLYLQDRIESGPHHAQLALGYTDHETAGTAVTWNAEYGYAVGASTQLYGLAGTGFRAPDATDRYGFGGNPDLEPEHSRNLELGVRHRVDTRHAFAVAAFRNDIDDLIEFVTISFDPFSGENRNVDEARIEGIEASWEYDAAPWQARLEAVHQNPRNLTTGEWLLRRARDSLTLSVERTMGPVAVGVDLLAAGERQDVGFPEPVTLDPYVLANLTARWQVNQAWALLARVENLLNEQYELARGFNTPDRGIYMSVRYAPARTTAAVAVAMPQPLGTPAATRGYDSGKGVGGERAWAID